VEANAKRNAFIPEEKKIIKFPQINLREFLKLRLASSQKEFRDLFRHSGHKRQTEHYTPFADRKEMRIEDRLQERHRGHK